MPAKELPIIICTDLIPAMMDGRKTVTQQVIKLPDCYKRLTWEYDGMLGTDYSFVLTDGQLNYNYHLVQPRYKKGDLLWVKQALWVSECGKYYAYDGYENADVIRISDGRFYYGGNTRNSITGKPNHRFMVGCYNNRDTGKGCRRKHRFTLDIGEYDTTKKIKPFTGNTQISSLDILFTKKRSSRFMPKWVARTWLKVLDVRAERLQEITPADCELEGLILTSNPWVWRYEFKRIQKHLK